MTSVRLQEPLAAYNQLSTRNVSELERYIAKQGLSVKVPGDIQSKRSHRFIYNALSLPNSWLSYLRFDTSVELRANTMLSTFNISMPAKQAYIFSNKITKVNNKLYAAIFAPDFDKQIKIPDDYTRYNLSIKQSSIVRILESIIGESITSPLNFMPTIELSTRAGINLSTMFTMMVNDADCDANMFNNKLISAEIEQLLITMLLVNQPHNYSKFLSPTPPPPTSKDVRKVTDYIHEHLNEPILLSELVNISGVPGRTLFAHFRQFTGRSPLQYATQQRLKKVRQDLLKESDSNTVTNVAMRWGFTQMGRFSGLYKKTYGESPSVTLKQKYASTYKHT